MSLATGQIMVWQRCRYAVTQQRALAQDSLLLEFLWFRHRLRMGPLLTRHVKACVELESVTACDPAAALPCCPLSRRAATLPATLNPGSLTGSALLTSLLPSAPPSVLQVGMSGICYPDSLIGTIPNIYYYAANNPSEATIAKRRSYANTISYLTPPAENAGLYKGLKELKELIASYQLLRASGRAEQVHTWGCSLSLYVLSGS